MATLRLNCLTLLIFFTFALTVKGKITKIEIKKIETYKSGQIFGTIGAYEKINGLAYGEVDPLDPSNQIIQDIKLAPRNERGKVEYISEVIMLRPVDILRNNRLLFVSLPNRGNVFPVDDYLLQRGYMVVWPAWQGDILPGNNRVLLQVPVATENGKPITGRHRAEYQVKKLTYTLPLSYGYFNGESHRSYPVVSLDNSTAVLTKREHESDSKIVIPNDEWTFSDCSTIPYPGNPSETQISLKNGFERKYIYELIYTAKDPLVLGLGLAVVRDIGTFLKTQFTDESGNKNPFLMPDNTIPVKAAIMQGVSQCGLFIRTFLQLGFNNDQGKMVYDGVNPHIGPRRLSLNVRFARPGGGAGQRTDHLFPSFEPPFTWDVAYDPVSRITGGILERCLETKTCPKIIQTFSSSEYWQLRASLRTTDSYGKNDIAIPDNVRVYLLAGTQHTPMCFNDPVSGFPSNSNSYQPQMNALLLVLENWVVNGTEPLPSCYPKISDGTLVLPDKRSFGWPNIPGINYRGLVNKGALINFGPDFNMKDVTGILLEPPVEMKGKDYTVLVPKVNSDGNEIAGIQNINMQVPLGTYTGWSIRGKNYGDGDLNDLNGMFIPFKKTKAERIAADDPRLSLEERYGSHEIYVEEVRKAAKNLVEQGFLLTEDARQAILDAEKIDLFNSK